MSPITPDIPGDTVRIDPPELAASAPALVVYLYLLSLPLLFAAFTATTGFRQALFSEPTLFLAGAVGAALLLWELYAAYKRWLVRRLTPRPADHSLESEALQNWCDTVTRSRRPPPFDAQRWIQFTGHGGPRLIAIDCDPPPHQPPSDWTEAADMGAARSLSRPERYTAWSLVVTAGVFIIMLFVSSKPFDWRMLLSPVFLVWSGYLLWAVNRLGLRLVSFTAAIATPGRFETSRFGREIDFTRDDSVLVLQKSPGQNQLRATFVRRDRRSYSIQFQGGSPHPALIQLLARWCCRAAPIPDDDPTLTTAS